MSKNIKVGFLMQNGLDIHRNSGPKVHFESVIKNFKRHGDTCKLISLQPGRKIVEYSSKTLKFEYKSLGLSGQKWFVLVEGIVRKLQTISKLPFLGIFDGYRFCEACQLYLADYDVFYERYSVMGFGGARAAKKMNKPLILEVHADIINFETPLHGEKLSKFQHFVAERITDYCFSNARKIVVISNAVRRRLENYWKVPPEKIEVVPLGVDIDLFKRALERLDSGSGLESQKLLSKTILFTGSFLSWHGVDVLINSFRRVVDQYPNVKLMLIGDGPTRTDMEEKVKQLALQDRVEFAGDVPHEEIPLFLQKADICVAPYKKLSSEMWFSSLKLFEYMYMEKAIVASNAGQISKILQHGYSGLLVEPDDPIDLAGAILELLLDPEKAKMMGKNAKKQVVNGYTWEDHCSKIKQIMLQFC